MTLLLRPWRHCCDFRGRSRRLEGVLFLATSLAGFVIVAAVGEFVMIRTGSPFASLSLGGKYAMLTIQPHAWPALIYLALCLVPGVALCVRRLHDMGLSGWLLAPCLVPIIGVFFGVVLAVAMLFPRDKTGGGRFGPDPRDPVPMPSDELASVFS